MTKYIYVDAAAATRNKRKVKADLEPVFRVLFYDDEGNETRVDTAHDIVIDGACALLYSPTPHKESGVIAHLEVEGPLFIDGKEYE